MMITGLRAASNESLSHKKKTGSSIEKKTKVHEKQI